LALAGIRLDWQEAHEDGNVRLAPIVAHSLRSVLREAVSNTIRHSGAQVMTVRVYTRDGRARLDIQDDGKGLAPDAEDAGNGLSNIEARLTALKGALAIEDAGPGVAIRAEFPLSPGTTQ
jgi:signal transduction histidine kinase